MQWLVINHTAQDHKRTYVPLVENNMINPSKIVKFIEDNDLGYILGNTIRSIIYARDETLTDEKRIQHLKDARSFINVEIKRRNKVKEK